MIIRIRADTEMMRTKQIRDYRANEIIFREGDAGDWAYLIESGQILVFVNKEGQEIPLKKIGRAHV